MKVLFLVNLIESPAPRPIRAISLGEGLRKLGVDVFFLSFSIAPEPSVPDNTTLMHYSLPVVGYRSTAELTQRYPRWFARGLRLINRFVRPFVFPDSIVLEKKKIIRHIEEIVSREQIEAVIAFILPYGLTEVAAAVKALGCKWIVDVGDPLSHNVADSQSDKDSRKLLYEKAYLSAADAVITTNQETTAYYREILEPSSIPPIESVYAGVPDAYLDIPEKRQLSEEVSMIYAGAFYPGGVRDPENLLSVIEEETFAEKNVFLTVYGFDSVRYRTYSHATFVRDRIPQRQLFDKYASADIALFIDNKLSMQIPSKLFELLALKRPLLFIYSDERSPAFKIAKPYEHVFFAKNDKKAIRQALHRCIESYATVHYSYPVEANVWSERAKQVFRLLQQLSGEK